MSVYSCWNANTGIPPDAIIGDAALSGIIEDGDTDAQAGLPNIQIEVGPMVLLLEESEEPGPSIVPTVRQECWWRRCCKTKRK
ncbi:unnamed protein product [Arctogadus glacialis]